MAAELLKFQWVQWIDMTKVAISNQIWQQGVIKYTTRVKFGPHINRSSLYCLVEMSRWRWNWWVCCGWSVQYSNVRLSSVQTFYTDFIIIMSISVKLRELTKKCLLMEVASLTIIVFNNAECSHLTFHCYKTDTGIYDWISTLHAYPYFWEIGFMILKAHSNIKHDKYQQFIPEYKLARKVEHFWNDVWGFLTWHLMLSLHTYIYCGPVILLVQFKAIQIPFSPKTAYF